MTADSQPAPAAAVLTSLLDTIADEELPVHQREACVPAAARMLRTLCSQGPVPAAASTQISNLLEGPMSLCGLELLHEAYMCSLPESRQVCDWREWHQWYLAQVTGCRRCK